MGVIRFRMTATKNAIVVYVAVCEKCGATEESPDNCDKNLFIEQLRSIGWGTSTLNGSTICFSCKEV